MRTISKQLKQFAATVTKVIQDHKGMDVRVLRVSKHCSYADYFVICSATSTRHARALADAVSEIHDAHAGRLEGYANGEWIIVDLKDVVVHVFHEHQRSYYCFDKLWPFVPIVNFEKKVPAQTKTKKGVRLRES